MARIADRRSVGATIASEPSTALRVVGAAGWALARSIAIVLLLVGWELLHDQEDLLGRCHDRNSTVKITELSELTRQSPTICAPRANRLPGWIRFSEHCEKNERPKRSSTGVALRFCVLFAVRRAV